MLNSRTLSARALFGIVYTTSVSSVYFALGVIAQRALGLTPVVFLVGGVFFALASMTYVEGAGLHRERGGSSVFARYAFNELVSFVAGWAILLDYAILLAVTAFTAANYLAQFWAPAGHGALEVILPIGVIAGVAVANVMGVTARQLRRQLLLAVADLGVQLLVIGLGIALVVDPGAIVDEVQLGSMPTWGDAIFALTVATIAFTGLEAAASLAGETTTTRGGIKRLVGPGVGAIALVYVGIGIVAVNALPVAQGSGALTDRDIEAPLLGVVSAFHPAGLASTMRYAVAAVATLALVGAANSAMLGISRLSYALATNRQIPSALGRLHPRRGTPFVLIGLAALLASALVIPADLEFLVGIYAFGAMLAFTIAHLSIVRLRFREPERERPYRMPLSLRVRGGELPLPALLGALLSGAGWISVLILHAGARYVGAGWLLGGLVLYVVYRRVDGNPLLRRVTVPEQALRVEAPRNEFGSILVPIFGEALDDDIVQTAGRLAGDVEDDDQEGATIEAIWVFEVPLSLPLDARLPEAQVKRAQEALRRAKAVGEEYEGVHVQTAMVRARRAGQAIVHEAKRRGVEAIVLAAEEPSRVRGGALFGGSGAPLENFVGDVTKYVVRKAECRVILTAPPAQDGPAAVPAPPAEPPAQAPR